jgi:hypothetical protein
LPLFSQLRFPFRYAIVAAMFACLAAARGFTVVEDALPRIEAGARTALRSAALRIALRVMGAAVAASIGIACVKDVLVENFVHPGALYNFDELVRIPDTFKQSRGNRWDAHVWPMLDRGSMHCFEENQLFESKELRGDRPHEEWATDPSAEVTREHWSPNKLVLRVKSANATRVVVNQNYNRSWKSNIGTVVSEDGLLAVDVGAGEQRIEIVFSDTRLRLGALISLATAMLLGRHAFGVLRNRWRSLVRLFRRRVEMPGGAPPS